MQVNEWGSGSEGTHAHGVLFKEKANGTFAELTRWPMDKLFVNAAPVAAELPDGAPVIFLATTAQYRHSPIYLAYVVPSRIGDAAAYHYLTGYDENGSPLWSSDMAEAKPLPGFENVWAGELSFLYDAPLNSYLLMFRDYSKANTFVLYSSSTPYGPFVGPLTFSPCGTTISRPEWMESGWGGCYGGYMLPDSFGADGHDLYFDISLWDPYTTVLMTMRLSTLSTTGSTSQITSTSTPVQSSTSTSPIPGFQGESIIAGIALGLAALILLRRRRR
jgi:MYXO-CTERM domain-containing protein